MKQSWLIFIALLSTLYVMSSCNSYDVEGIPQIRAEPGQIVVPYFPFTDKGDSGNTGGDTGDTADSGNTADTGDTTDTGDTADSGNTADTGDTTDTGDTADSGNTADTGDTTDTGDTADTTVIYQVRASQPTSGAVASPAQPDAKDDEHVFTIYNDGVTGQLHISALQLIDPAGHVITDKSPLSGLFSFQIQKTTGGVAGDDETFDPHRYLSLDQADSQIADFCPLYDEHGKKVCRKGFDAKKYNEFLKIKVNYHYNGALGLMKNKDVPEAQQVGAFRLRICTNDPMQTSADTCPAGTTAFDFAITRLPKRPPKPVIKMAFHDSTGLDEYRVISDTVRMDLGYTCVSNEDTPDPNDCLPESAVKDRYYFVFKWEMSESPTPLRSETWLTLVNDQGAGSWNPYDPSDQPIEGSVDPIAGFEAYMITPVVYADKDHANPDFNEKCKDDPTPVCGEKPERPDIPVDGEMTQEKVDAIWNYVLKKSQYLLCVQKYCTPYKSRYYKINVSAKVVDKMTDQESEEVSVDILPTIIPKARVMVQLTWKQGLQSEADLNDTKGMAVDLDVHLIKKTSLEGSPSDTTYGDFGYMCTQYAKGGECLDRPTCTRHDDTNQGDRGTSYHSDDVSIKWNSQLDLDNRWGGGNYENPETINLLDVGCYTNPGSCDLSKNNDDYLVVVTYYDCNDRDLDDGNDCETSEVDAEVKIFIDGDLAPRSGVRESDGRADSVDPASLKFKIKPHQWKVIAEINWNGSSKPRQGKRYEGDAVVTDAYAKTFPLCTWDSSFCYNNLVPVWGNPVQADGAQAYRTFVTSPPPEGGDTPIGSCQ